MSGAGTPAQGPEGWSGYRRLAPGRHGLSRGVVAEDQRRRVLAAAAELFAERGYAALSIRALCARAGVSVSTFYANFANLDACLAASWSLGAEALEELATASMERTERGNRAPRGTASSCETAVASILAFLAAESGLAQLLGNQGAAIDIVTRRRERLLSRLASRLACLRGAGTGSPTELLLVGGVLGLIGSDPEALEGAELTDLLMLGAA